MNQYTLLSFNQIQTLCPPSHAARSKSVLSDWTEAQRAEYRLDGSVLIDGKVVDHWWYERTDGSRRIKPFRLHDVRHIQSSLERAKTLFPALAARVQTTTQYFVERGLVGKELPFQLDELEDGRALLYYLRILHNAEDLYSDTIGKYSYSTNTKYVTLGGKSDVERLGNIIEYEKLQAKLDTHRDEVLKLVRAIDRISLYWQIHNTLHGRMIKAVKQKLPAVTNVYTVVCADIDGIRFYFASDPADYRNHDWNFLYAENQVQIKHISL